MFRPRKKIWSVIEDIHENPRVSTLGHTLCHNSPCSWAEINQNASLYMQCRVKADDQHRHVYVTILKEALQEHGAWADFSLIKSNIRDNKLLIPLAQWTLMDCTSMADFPKSKRSLVTLLSPHMDATRDAQKLMETLFAVGNEQQINNLISSGAGRFGGYQAQAVNYTHVVHQNKGRKLYSKIASKIWLPPLWLRNRADAQFRSAFSDVRGQDVYNGAFQAQYYLQVQWVSGNASLSIHTRVISVQNASDCINELLVQNGDSDEESDDSSDDESYAPVQVETHNPHHGVNVLVGLAFNLINRLGSL